MASSDAVNYLRAAVGQGVGMGWGDEAEAWLRSKLPQGRPYQEELARINQEYSDFAKKNRFGSSAAELAGGFVPGMLIPPVGVASRATGALSRLAASPVTRGAVIGAGFGGVAGAGSAQPDKRLEGALEGSASGAVLGAAIPAAIRGGSAAAGWLRERLVPSEGTITSRAAGKINQALREGDLTPSAIAEKVAADRASGIPSTLANTDPSLVALAETVAQRSGAGSRRVQERLGGQAAGSRERVYSKVKGALHPEEFHAEEQKLIESLRRQAASLYDDAYKIGSVKDPRILNALEDPQFKKFYDRAREIADREALAAKLRGEDPRKYQLESIYTVDADGVAKLTDVPDVRTLDYIKRGIDATVERGFKGEGMSTAEANSLRELRKVFVNAIDEATLDPTTGVSPYKAARAAYAGDMEVLDALRKGRKEFKKLDHEEVVDMLKTMSSAEKDAFRTGVVRDMYDTIMTPSATVNAAQRVIGSPETNEKLKPLFDTPEHFNLFKTAIERESQLFQQASRILAGSPTERRIQARESFERNPPVGQVVGDAIAGGFNTSLINLAARSARNATMSDAVADKVSKLLMSSDPHEVAAAVKLLEKYGSGAERASKALGRAESGLVSGSAVATPPQYYETPARNIDTESFNMSPEEVESRGTLTRDIDEDLLRDVGRGEQYLKKYNNPGFE